MGVTAGATFSLATPRPVALPCLRPIERGHRGPSAYTLPALDQATAHCTWGTQPRAGGFCQGLCVCVWGVGGGEGLWTSSSLPGALSSSHPAQLSRPWWPLVQGWGPQGRESAVPIVGTKALLLWPVGEGGAGRRRALGEGHTCLWRQGGRFTLRPSALSFHRAPLPGNPSQCLPQLPQRAQLTLEWHRNPR